MHEVISKQITNKSVETDMEQRIYRYNTNVWACKGVNARNKSLQKMMNEEGWEKMEYSKP